MCSKNKFRSGWPKCRKCNTAHHVCVCVCKRAKCVHFENVSVVKLTRALNKTPDITLTHAITEFLGYYRVLYNGLVRYDKGG